MIITPWGYDIDATSLPPIIDVGTFNDFTGGRWAGDSRVQNAIMSVTNAARTYCGWHIGPSCSCKATIDGEPGDIWLPVACLTGVSSVEVGGEAVGIVSFSRRGRVRVSQAIPFGLGNVEVEFTAGIPICSMPDLAKTLADAVVSQIALTSYGVSQEVAGDVSISYSGAALSAQGRLLTPNVCGALAPYRVVRAHAA